VAQTTRSPISNDLILLNWDLAPRLRMASETDEGGRR
jgi:hypothetical protein